MRGGTRIGGARGKSRMGRLTGLSSKACIQSVAGVTAKAGGTRGRDEPASKNTCRRGIGVSSLLNQPVGAPPVAAATISAATADPSYPPTGAFHNTAVDTEPVLV